MELPEEDVRVNGLVIALNILCLIDLVTSGFLECYWGALNQHWEAHNRFQPRFGTSFWDFVPMPTKPFGDINIDVQTQLLKEGLPLCMNLFNNIEETNCKHLFMLLHSRTWKKHNTPSDQTKTSTDS